MVTGPDGREPATETADYEWVNVWAEQARQPSARQDDASPRPASMPRGVVASLFRERAAAPPAANQTVGASKHGPLTANAPPKNHEADQLTRDIAEIETARAVLAGEESGRVRRLQAAMMPWRAERYTPVILGTAIALLMVMVSIAVAVARLPR